MEGTFIVPKFILEELQYIADSSDDLRRTRGRRGLDILKRLQQQNPLRVEFTEDDMPTAAGADSKLVALALKLRAKIITNDFNLHKVAELQGLEVLNINQLANAMKPAVLPGETLQVQILREGKSQGQGIAYLDDGTMVVIENARRFIGKEMEVAVTSVLQTTAGRMIFSEIKNGGSALAEGVIKLSASQLSAITKYGWGGSRTAPACTDETPLPPTTVGWALPTKSFLPLAN